MCELNSLKKHVVIIGAGLAGVTIASKLADHFYVTLITGHVSYSLSHTDISTSNYPLVSGGLGGTTNLWHSALIEIDERCLYKKDLYNENFREEMKKSALIFGIDLEIEQRNIENKICSLGNLESKVFYIGKPMFVSIKRKNIQSTMPIKKINILKSSAKSYRTFGDIVTSVHLEDGNKVSGDIYIDCAGGLGSLNTLWPLIRNKKDESIYCEEHLTAFIGTLEVDKFEDAQKLLFTGVKNEWQIRLPFVVKFSDEYSVALYLRPHYQILSNSIYTKFGKLLPTKKFKIFAVFQTKRTDCHINIINNRLEFNSKTAHYLKETSPHIVEQLIKNISFPVVKYNAFNPKSIGILSGAHFSGTIPLGNKKEPISRNFEVRGYKNFYACSGAVIPESGYSNTGLTLFTMASQLSNLLMNEYQ